MEYEVAQEGFGLCARVTLCAKYNPVYMQSAAQATDFIISCLVTLVFVAHLYIPVRSMHFGPSEGRPWRILLMIWAPI